MSYCTMAMSAMKKAVMPPTMSTIERAVSESSNSGDMRATMKIPAVTMVAAWISAEIGVGPSIESGSHTCSGNCALLPIAPMKSPMQIAESSSHGAPGITSIVCCARAREHRRVVQGPEIRQHQSYPEQEAEVADPVDEERLQIRVDRGRPRIPEA